MSVCPAVYFDSVVLTAADSLIPLNRNFKLFLPKLGTFFRKLNTNHTPNRAALGNLQEIFKSLLTENPHLLVMQGCLDRPPEPIT